MTPEIQNKLAQLRDKYKGHAESQSDLDGIEKELLANIQARSDITKVPIFIAIVSDAEKKIADINTLLLNDENLSSEDRKVLIKSKNIWQFVFKRFGTTLYDDAIKSLEQYIDSRLGQ